MNTCQEMSKKGMNRKADEHRADPLPSGDSYSVDSAKPYGDNPFLIKVVFPQPLVPMTSRTISLLMVGSGFG